MIIYCISQESISLMRELLSLLVFEEKLLIEGKQEEKRQISKKRYAIHRKLRFLNEQYTLPLYQEESDLREVYESLKTAIFFQKKRNLLLQKRGCREMGVVEKMKPEKKPNILLTLLDDSTAE